MAAMVEYEPAKYKLESAESAECLEAGRGLALAGPGRVSRPNAVAHILHAPR